jgi:hypothetical protein
MSAGTKEDGRDADEEIKISPDFTNAAVTCRFSS